MQRTISTCYFLVFFAMATATPYLSLYLRGRGMDGTQIGLLLAVGAAAGTLVQPILGVLNDRATDPRRILVCGSVLCPIFYAGYAVFKPFWVLVLVAILVALAQSTLPILDAISVKEGELAGFSYGHVRLWGAFSFALAAALAGYVYHRVGLGYSFVVYAGLSGIMAWAMIYLPKSGGAGHVHEPILNGIWNVVRRKNLMAFIVICFLLATTTTMNSSFLPLYYQYLHYPMGWVGMNFTVAALVEVPFFYVSGKLVRRFGWMRVLIVGGMAYMIKYVIMALAPGAALVIGVQVLDGIGYALYWSASVQLVAQLAPENLQATAQTVYGAVASSFSSILGTVTGGFLFDHVGPLFMYKFISVVAGLAVVGYGLFAKYGMPKREGRPQQNPQPHEPLDLNNGL